MNAYIRKGQLLLAVLLGVIAGQEVQARCTTAAPNGSSFGFRPTMRIDASVAVGAIMYDETKNISVVVSCDGIGENRVYSMAYPTGGYQLMDGREITAHSYDSTVDFPGIEKSADDSTVTHFFPSGIFTRTFSAAVNLRYRRGSGTVSATLYPRAGGAVNAFNKLGSTPLLPEGTSFALFLSGSGPSVSNATCTISSQTVQMPRAPLRSFTGVASVPNEGKTDFDVALSCSNVNVGMRIGLSFAPSDQHESGAAGVIRTTQGANNASDIALQIINRTSNVPIQFGQFEPGVPKTGNGMYHNIYRVQYFQSGPNPTAGTVTGQTTATVVYQ